MEEWKDIRGYEGVYQVSTFGRIRSVDRVIYGDKSNLGMRGWWKSRKVNGAILSCPVNVHGYNVANLSRNGVAKTILVSRVVAEAFIVKTKNKNQVNHIDGNKQNNHISNLEWVTAKENTNHIT